MLEAAAVSEAGAVPCSGFMPSSARTRLVSSTLADTSPPLSETIASGMTTGAADAGKAFFFPSFFLPLSALFASSALSFAFIFM